MSELLNKAISGIALTPTEVAKVKNKLASDGKDFSDSLIAGLESGVLFGSDKLNAIGLSAAYSVTAGTKTGLEAHSPSRVFMRIGADVVAGLAMGISNFMPNLYSVVQGMVSVFIQAGNQITSAMNMIRMQVFQIQGYMQTVQNSQMQAQLAYQQAQQAAMISAAQKTASAASTIGSAFTGSPLIPPVNQIIVNTQPQTTSTTTTNLNTTVSGVTMSTEDEAAYVIERTLRSVKGGLVSWN